MIEQKTYVSKNTNFIEALFDFLGNLDFDIDIDTENERYVATHGVVSFVYENNSLFFYHGSNTIANSSSTPVSWAWTTTVLADNGYVFDCFYEHNNKYLLMTNLTKNSGFTLMSLTETITLLRSHVGNTYRGYKSENGVFTSIGEGTEAYDLSNFKNQRNDSEILIIPYINLKFAHILVSEYFYSLYKYSDPSIGDVISTDNGDFLVIATPSGYQGRSSSSTFILRRITSSEIHGEYDDANEVAY